MPKKKKVLFEYIFEFPDELVFNTEAALKTLDPPIPKINSRKKRRKK